MEIKKSVVDQIIKEETLKLQKVILLKEEKGKILKQLNELYEENVMEEESIADLMPPQDKQEFVQSTQVAQPEASTLEEGVMSGVLGKIQNLVTKNFKEKYPNEFQKDAATLASQYGNKSFGEIYNFIKGVAQSSLAEGVGEGKKPYSAKDVTEKTNKVAENVFQGAMLSAMAMGLPAVIISSISGGAQGIPTILGAGAVASLIAAAIAGVIWVMSHMGKTALENV